jgi:hypothetical protein
VPYEEMVESRIKTIKSTIKEGGKRKKERKRCGEYVHQSSPFNFPKSSGPALVGGSLFTLEKSLG